MPGLRGSPGIEGDTGFHYWLHYGVRGGAEISLPEGLGIDQIRLNQAQTGDVTQPASAVLDLTGMLGSPGATLVPNVFRSPELGRRPGPIQFVPRLLEFWRLKETDAVRLLGFGPEEVGYVASALAGRAPFHGRDVRERIAHLFWIRKTLSAWLRDPDTENAWLREAHSWLDGRAPMELLLGGSMEDLLLVRDYVDTAAGV